MVDRQYSGWYFVDISFKGCVSMIAMPIEVRKQVLRYYENHNTEQTAKEFVISKQTVFRYTKQYDGTDDSLMDGRKKRNRKSSYTDAEEEKLFSSLKEYNQKQRKRNAITPSYTEIYQRLH